MRKEIERKFLIRKMPGLSGLRGIIYERHYLFVGNGIELRVQKRGDKFEIERKTADSNLSIDTQKMEISKEEFEVLKKNVSKTIIRESYLISEKPEITIKVYHGSYEGLIRAEVEFQSEAEAKNFQMPDWFGKEITDSPLGRDSKLIKLGEKEFTSLVN